MNERAGAEATGATRAASGAAGAPTDAPGAAPLAGPVVAPLVEPMKRAAIIVRDLERSLAFYQDALGLTVWSEGEAGPENRAFARLLGMPPCRVRYVILQSGALALGMVGLFEVREPAPQEASVPTRAAVNRGEVVLVFHTRDVHAVAERAAALGLEILCPPERLLIPEVGVDSIEMTLRDPNGVLVNLIEPRNAGPQGSPRLRSRFSG